MCLSSILYVRIHLFHSISSVIVSWPVSINWHFVRRLSLTSAASSVGWSWSHLGGPPAGRTLRGNLLTIRHMAPNGAIGQWRRDWERCRPIENPVKNIPTHVKFAGAANAECKLCKMRCFFPCLVFIIFICFIFVCFIFFLNSFFFFVLLCLHCVAKVSFGQ